MNNRNREQEQRERERSERNRYSTSGYGSDEGDYGPAQYGGQNESSGLSGQRGSPRQSRDRDVQGDYSSGGWQQGRGSQQGYGREASHGQGLGDRQYASQHPNRPQYGQRAERYASQPAPSQYGAQGSRYGSQGYASEYGAGSESFESQDFSQDYSQGSSHYGSQGFGAQGSPGVFGPQGFGSQGARSSSDYERQSGYGGYGRDTYGASQPGRDYRASPGQWRGSDTGRSSESGLSGGMGGSTSYRGRGPKNYVRSDERIREDLNERLTDSDEIDASNISVEVSNGVATLKGSVDERWMKHRAEDLAESCSGVRDVDNQIRVLPQGAARTSMSASATPGGGSAASGSSSLGTSGADTLGATSVGQSTSAGSAGSGSASTGKTGGSPTHN